MSTNTPKPPPVPYGHHANGFPVDVGPENELVGEDEQLPELFEYTLDGTTWLKHSCGSCSTVKDFVSHHWLTQGILAIRRRKVVKDEWPKYWEGYGDCYRQLGAHHHQQFFKDGRWNDCASDDILYWMKIITPQSAFELTGDKSILEKGGDEKCVSHTEVTATSPAPEPTAKEPDAQGASISRIVLALRELANALENKH